MGELRTWIRKLLKSDDMRIQDRVQNELKLSVGRLLLMDGQKVDYHDYLNRNNDEDSDDGYSDHSDEDVSDDEDDYDHGSVIDVKQEKKDIAIKGNNKVEKLKEAIIEFSDDEDDDEDVEDDHDTVDNNDDKENKDDSSQLSHSHEEPTQVQESFDNLEEPDAPIRNGISEELRRKFMFPTSLDMQENTRRHTSMDLFKANPLLARRPLNPHQALKMSLYKKVLVAGQENLCKSMNILTSQLDLYQDIVDKCRSFIEIIRDREDRLQRRQQRKDEEDRERRRVQFLEQAYDDDEEFDEDGIDESGPKMTEEQKQKILADFQNWPDEENDNDDNNDDDGDEHEDEDDEEQKRLKNKINDKKLTEKLLKKIKKASGESEVTNKAVKAVADEDEDEASDDNASSADESSASSDEDGDDDDDSDNSTTAMDTDMITDSDKPSENKTSKSLRKLSKKSKIIVTEDDNADEDVDEHTDSKISSAVSTSALISKPNSITRDEESGPVVRRTYGRPSASQRISMDSDDDNDDENDVSAAPRDRSIDEEQTAPQISMNNTDLDSDQRMTATQGQGDQEDDDGQQTQPQQDNDNDDDADNEEENDTVKVAPKLKKPKSSAFRKMVEEEERRSKVEKVRLVTTNYKHRMELILYHNILIMLYF